MIDVVQKDTLIRFNEKLDMLGFIPNKGLVRTGGRIYNHDLIMKPPSAMKGTRKALGLPSPHARKDQYSRSNKKLGTALEEDDDDDFKEDVNGHVEKARGGMDDNDDDDDISDMSEPPSPETKSFAEEQPTVSVSLTSHGTHQSEMTDLYSFVGLKPSTSLLPENIDYSKLNSNNQTDSKSNDKNRDLSGSAFSPH